MIQFPIFVSVLIFLLMDFMYISLIKDEYAKMIMTIQCGKNVVYNIFYAILCYIILLIGLVVYVLRYAQLEYTLLYSNTNTNTRHVNIYDLIRIAFWTGGIFGFVVYGVLSTTNLALFRSFSSILGFMDIIWGTTLYFTTTLVYLLIYSYTTSK
jgi:uncharacterized membrane protein